MASGKIDNAACIIDDSLVFKKVQTVVVVADGVKTRSQMCDALHAALTSYVANLSNEYYLDIRLISCPTNSMFKNSGGLIRGGSNISASEYPATSFGLSANDDYLVFDNTQIKSSGSHSASIIIKATGTTITVTSNSVPAQGTNFVFTAFLYKKV